MARATRWIFHFRLFLCAVSNPQVLSSWNSGPHTLHEGFIQQKQGGLRLEFLPAFATDTQPGAISVGNIGRSTSCRT